ncbi:MAG: secretin and TonB N-terminal domain-containing protein, partial [Planctomycetota bacterium]
QEAQEPDVTAEVPQPFQHLEEDATITVNFQDEDLGEILELFSTNYELNLVYGSDVLGTVTMNFFNAPVQDALKQLLAANGFAYEVDGNFLIIKPAPAALPGAAAASKFLPTVIYLNHVRTDEVMPMLAPLLSGPEKMIAGMTSQSGLDTSELGGKEEASRETLVVYASDLTVQKVYDLLSILDVPPTQILVEATILSVSLSDDSQLGVDISAFGGIDFEGMGGQTSISDGISTQPTSGNELQSWLGGLSQRGFTDPSADGLHFGILRNQVGIFVSALESVSNTTVLSNPQVLTVNRHAAELLVGRKLPYITTTTTETGTLQSVSFLEVGTSLIFRPFVTDDGYVRMEIYPKKSDGFINSLGLPEETTTELRTNILVKEGNTVVIGGLIETGENTEIEQVPLLGSIPYLGQLFRSEIQVESKNEIIILLTPHVVDDLNLAKRSEQARIRIDGARAQLAASHHGYLRPSYARRLYGEAATALAAGDPSTALAKAEWGLSAMPADPDLAALVYHCRKEIHAQLEESTELKDTIDFLDDLRKEEDSK